LSHRIKAEPGSATMHSDVLVGLSADVAAEESDTRRMNGARGTQVQEFPSPEFLDDYVKH